MVAKFYEEVERKPVAIMVNEKIHLITDIGIATKWLEKNKDVHKDAYIVDYVYPNEEKVKEANEVAQEETPENKEENI